MAIVDAWHETGIVGVGGVGAMGFIGTGDAGVLDEPARM